jgi:hypothetical protein
VVVFVADSATCCVVSHNPRVDIGHAVLDLRTLWTVTRYGLSLDALLCVSGGLHQRRMLHNSLSVVEAHLQ